MTADDADRLRLALVAAGLGEWSWDTATDIVTFSERGAEIYGIPPGPVMTWTQMRELLHPDDREATRLAVETALLHKTDYTTQYRLINGTRERWIAVSGHGHYDETGKAVGMVGVVHDRTRERALATLDELLRPLSDAAAITAAAAEFLGRMLDADRCAYAIVEADEDTFELVGDYVRGVKSIVGRYRFRQFGKACLRLMRAGQPFVVNDRTRDPRLEDDDQAVYDLTQIDAVICAPILKSGRFAAAMAVHCATPRTWSHEDTELVQATASRCWESIERARIEQALRDNMAASRSSERRDAFLVRLDDSTRPLTEPATIAQTVLRLLCEELGADRATYFEIDEDGHAGHVLADYAPRLVPLQGVYPLEEYGTEFARTVRTGSIYLLEDIARADLTDAERRRFHAIQISAELMVPLHKAGALKATLGLFQGRPRIWEPEEIHLCQMVVQRCWDSLERARIEREVRVADRRKDEFIATLAHELRNPLAPIRNGLVLLKRSDDQAVRRKMQEMMERQVDHLVRMVDDLIDVSRINRGMIELQTTAVPLEEPIRDAVEAALPAIQASAHVLDLDLPGGAVLVRGDPVRLTQVFANLLNNAAKFTPDGGSIRLKLAVEDAAAFVTVEDNGIGISPSSLHEIFEIFVQDPEGRKRGRGGLGIGLSLVRRLIVMHGGQVTAHSEGMGRGSRFEVRLPLMAAQPALLPAGDPATVKGVRARVLVVDDNRDAADSIAALLRLEGWDVAVAYDGPAALQLLLEGRFAFALLDLGMPAMDGYELARRIRQAGHTKLVLVALTGWGQASDRARTQEAGFDQHLVKPVELPALLRILQGGPAFRPARS